MERREPNHRISCMNGRSAFIPGSNSDIKSAEQIKMFSSLQKLTLGNLNMRIEAELNRKPNGYINLWAFFLSLSCQGSKELSPLLFCCLLHRDDVTNVDIIIIFLTPSPTMRSSSSSTLDGWESEGIVKIRGGETTE